MSDSGGNAPVSADDDWAAALKEQAASSAGATIEPSSAVEALAQPANIFPRLAPGTAAENSRDVANDGGGTNFYAFCVFRA